MLTDNSKTTKRLLAYGGIGRAYANFRIREKLVGMLWSAPVVDHAAIRRAIAACDHLNETAER